MCHLRSIVLILLSSLCILGCRSSVWKSDACKSIDHHVTSMQPIDLPLFKHQKEDKVFRISESLTLPVGMESVFLLLAMGHANNHSMTGETDADHGVEAAAHKALVVSGMPVLKKTPFDSAKGNIAISDKCIDLNTADIAQLITLPGIGQARAESIVQARNKRAFKRKKDITKIKGISAKSYHKLQEYLCEI